MNPEESGQWAAVSPSERPRLMKSMRQRVFDRTRQLLDAIDELLPPDDEPPTGGMAVGVG